MSKLEGNLPLITVGVEDDTGADDGAVVIV